MDVKKLEIQIDGIVSLIERDSIEEYGIYINELVEIRELVKSGDIDIARRRFNQILSEISKVDESDIKRSIIALDGFLRDQAA